MVIAVTVKTGKFLDRIVIAGVVAIGAFVAIIAQRDFALDHDLGFGGHLQRLGHATAQLDPFAAQKAAN